MSRYCSAKRNHKVSANQDSDGKNYQVLIVHQLIQVWVPLWKHIQQAGDSRQNIQYSSNKGHSALIIRYERIRMSSMVALLIYMQVCAHGSFCIYVIESLHD